MISAGSVLLGTLLGGALGGTTSFLVARMQINHESQTDRHAFVREQRQATYSKMVHDAQLLLTGVATCDGTPISDDGQGHISVLLSGVSLSDVELQNTTDDWSIDLTGASLVGSADVAAAAAALDPKLGSLVLSCVTSRIQEPMPPHAIEDAKERIQVEMPAAIAALGELMTLAREDLDADSN